MAEIVGWFSLKGGAHIPIMKGQSRAEAAKKYYASKHGKTVAKLSSKTSSKNKSEDIGYESKITRKELMDKYNISSEERNSVREYTADGYKDINEQLIKYKGNLDECSFYVSNNCDYIDSALQKLPKHEGLVHRKEPMEMASKYKEGHTYSHDNYTSTTAWMDWNNTSGVEWKSTEGHVQLEIKQSSGSNVSKLSANPKENEVILPRGFTYKVNKIEKIGDNIRVYAEEVKQ